MEPQIPDLEDLQRGEPAPAEKGRAAQQGGKPPPFAWSKAWYPLAPVSYLDPRRPHALTVLGHRLAVWWDREGAGAWRAFEDRCPHRLAPLSEGRINPDTGRLQCSYHGWQFGGSGACAAIPQADSERQREVACSSSRGCAASYPTRVEQGMLWVWMDSSAGAAAESAAAAPALPSELQDGSGMLLGDWYMRDLPVSYEYLLENLLDPAHIHWSHHKVIGNRDLAGPLKLELNGEVTEAGFTMLWGNRGQTSATTFAAPCLAWLRPRWRGTAPNRFSLIFYAVPVVPGQSRIVAGYSATVARGGWLGRLLRSERVAPLLRGLQFLSCLGSHEVLDGDTLFIRDQEQNALLDGRGWKTNYFIPASADRGVAVLRRWFEREGGGGPAYGPFGATPLRALAPMTREQALDRYGQHTQYCPSCRRVLTCVRGLRSLLSLATTAGLATGLALAAARPAPAAPSGNGPLAAVAGAVAGTPAAVLAGAALCTLARRALGRLERRLVFTDYTHWDK